MDKCHGFFKILKSRFWQILKGNFNFGWTEECEKAFNELKSYLRSPHLLVKSSLRDVLQLYLVVLDYAVSSMLVKFKGKEQKPIFYMSIVQLD